MIVYRRTDKRRAGATDRTRGRDPAELAPAPVSCRTAFVGVGLLGGVVNVPTLTGSFFMLEVYDRMIPSRSVPTLIGLMVLALALYAFQGALEAIRSRIFARVGAALGAALSGRVFDVRWTAGARPTDCNLARSD